MLLLMACGGGSTSLPCEERYEAYVQVKNSWQRPYNIFVEGQLIQQVAPGETAMFTMRSGNNRKVVLDRVGGNMLTIAPKRCEKVLNMLPCSSYTIPIEE